MYVYQPDKYQIAIGLPPTAITITDWVRLTTNKNARFEYSEGVVDTEPFLEFSSSSSRIFSLSILQTSPQVELLRNFFITQLTGLVGFPFSIIDFGKDEIANQNRQRSFYPVAWIIEEPEDSFELQGNALLFRIQTAGGATIFS